MKITYTLPDAVYKKDYTAYTINPNEFVLFKKLFLYSSSDKLYFNGSVYLDEGFAINPDDLFLFHKNGGTIQIQGTYASLSYYEIYKIVLPLNEGWKFYTHNSNLTYDSVELTLDDINNSIPLLPNTIGYWQNYRSGATAYEVFPYKSSYVIYENTSGYDLVLNYGNSETVSAWLHNPTTPRSSRIVALRSSFIIPPKSVFTGYYESVSYKAHLRRIIYESGSNLYELNGTSGSDLDVLVTEQDVFVPTVFYYIKSIEFDIPEI
ncbi:MAG: hypothetical protein KatS3mg003_1060 [Candidatus Nitrosocaldaceae archaeon]|nr:MAG: hypothetical protein KatS3mg003_1060 [Candidatus Nitrosocaldaceae archaeon]